MGWFFIFSKTPLHFAAANGHLRVVEFLKSKGGIEFYQEEDDWEEESLDEVVIFEEESFDINAKNASFEF